MRRRTTTTPGTVYLICCRNPDGSKGWLGGPGKFGAGHYAGWAERERRSFARGLASRLEEHRTGRGARITAAMVAAGLVLEVCRTWRGTEQNEKWLKDRNSLIDVCPWCSPVTAARRCRVLGVKPFRRPRRRHERPVDLAALAAASSVPAVDGQWAPWPEQEPA